MDAARLTTVGFLIALVLGLLTGPAVAQPSAGKLAKVVVLSVGVNPPSAPFNVAFEQRLRDLGWVEGRTMSLQWRAAKAGETANTLGIIVPPEVLARADTVVQ